MHAAIIYKHACISYGKVSSPVLHLVDDLCARLLSLLHLQIINLVAIAPVYKQTPCTEKLITISVLKIFVYRKEGGRQSHKDSRVISVGAGAWTLAVRMALCRVPGPGPREPPVVIASDHWTFQSTIYIYCILRPTARLFCRLLGCEANMR